MNYFLILLLLFPLLPACQSVDSASPSSQAASLAEIEPTDTAVSALPPLPELDAEAVALGKTVYEQNCAACHGANLEGQPDWKTQNADGSFKAPPHTADGHTWHHADQQLLAAIRLGGARFEGMDIGGTSPMPAYADILMDEEITAVLTYIKSTWPDDIRQTQWEVTVMSTQD